MKDVKYYVKISFLPILVDKTQQQLSKDYHKTLLDENNNIISKTIEVEQDLETVLRELYKQYLKYNYDWSYKFIGSARKIKNVVEICYVSYMPYIKDFQKQGNVVSVHEVFALEDKFYGKVATLTASESFR